MFLIKQSLIISIPWSCTWIPLATALKMYSTLVASTPICNCLCISIILQLILQLPLPSLCFKLSSLFSTGLITNSSCRINSLMWCLERASQPLFRITKHQPFPRSKSLTCHPCLDVLSLFSTYTNLLKLQDPQQALSLNTPVLPFMVRILFLELHEHIVDPSFVILISKKHQFYYLCLAQDNGCYLVVRITLGRISLFLQCLDNFTFLKYNISVLNYVVLLNRTIKLTSLNPKGQGSLRGAKLLCSFWIKVQGQGIILILNHSTLNRVHCKVSISFLL